MKYYELSVFGDYGEEGFCFTDDRLEGIGQQGYMLEEGSPLKDYPVDSSKVTLKLDDDNPGLKKGSLLGNSSSLLILDKSAKDIVTSYVKESIQCLQFTLLDHKGRVHSSDYFVINPLTVLKCINEEASNIKYKNDKIKVIRKLVFDASAMTMAPHMFRVDPIVYSYYVSEELKNALEVAGATNLLMKEIPVQ